MATIIQAINEEDMKELGLTISTPLAQAVKMVNDVPYRELYDDQLDMNSYIVGWEGTIQNNPIIQRIFSRQTVRTIQQKVSEYLAGVDEQGRKIIPTERVVIIALYGVYRSHQPQVGDMYGKYLVNNMDKRNDYAYIVDKTVSLVVRGIRDEAETIQNNEKLTIWTTVLGDFNEHGLRQHPPIKIREKRADNFLFHMRY